MAEAVQNTFVRQNVTRGNDIRDAGLIIGGKIALGVTGRGEESGGEDSG